MFKRMTIVLTEPICRCDVENLSWWPSKNADDQHTLTITCKTCKTSLVVGSDHYKASFTLDKPYPGKKPEKKTERKVEVIEGCKILPFFAPIAEEP